MDKKIQSDELYHWKYINKIKTGSGMRYFYSMDEYRAYLDGLKGVKDKIEKYTSTKIGDKTKRFLKKAKSGNKFTRKLKNIGEKSVDKGRKFAIEKLTIIATDKDEEKLAKQYKYLHKEFINGKVRYFYSEDEWDAYQKREEYWDKEPDFMKGLKKSKDFYTAEEDAILVNPNYESEETQWQYNCAECSAIYELRRRGYDVESNGMGGGFPLSETELDNDFKLYQNLQKVFDNAIGSEFYNSDERFDMLYKNAKVQHVPAKDDPISAANAIAAEIRKNPPGSRGEIGVVWDGLFAGGHSMVWELDSNNEIHIIDTQVSGHGRKVEYNLSTLTRRMENGELSRWFGDGMSGTTITRTDNLEFKPGVLGIIRNSEDNKRRANTQTNEELNPGTLDIDKHTKKMTKKERKTKYPLLG